MIKWESSLWSDLLLMSAQISWTSVFQFLRLSFAPVTCRDSFLTHTPIVVAGYLWNSWVPTNQEITGGSSTPMLWQPYYWLIHISVSIIDVTCHWGGFSVISRWILLLYPELCPWNRQSVISGISDLVTPTDNYDCFIFLVLG